MIFLESQAESVIVTTEIPYLHMVGYMRWYRVVSECVSFHTSFDMFWLANLN